MAQKSQDLLAELGNRIRAARYLSGKEGSELAAELGWSKRKLYRFERNEQMPDARDLARIAEATGQPVDFFYGTTSPAAQNGPTFFDAAPAVKGDNE